MKLNYFFIGACTMGAIACAISGAWAVAALNIFAVWVNVVMAKRHE